MSRPGTVAKDATEDIVARGGLGGAAGRLGRYGLRCLSFVEDAYEVPNEIEVFGGARGPQPPAGVGLSPSTR